MVDGFFAGDNHGRRYLRRMDPTSPAGRTAHPSAADFRVRSRGGGFFSELVNQRAGAWLALAGDRLGLSPSILTMTGLTVGISTSVSVLLLAPATTRDAVSALIVGLAAGLGWQLAYTLDCADGQLARATGRTSAAGARLDILCDVAVQISVVAAVSSVAAAHTPSAPSWIYAVFAGTWMVNLVTSVLAGGPATGSLLTSRSNAARALKLVRDYGAVIAATALVLAVAPGWTIWLLVVLSIGNGLFLVASIAAAAGRALTGAGGA